VFGFSPVARPAAEIRADRERKPPRMRELLGYLDHPERTFASILVAGTKGKGSTAAMLESMLRQAGHPTGLYTQPHLHTWRERTRLGARLIEPDEVVALLPAVRGAVERLERNHPELGRPTTFEVGTALTFLAFATHGVRTAVVEVGVGGAHDATNAVEPILVTLTPISLDHVATLGGSLASIAAEKAGLFRPDGRAVVGRQPPEALAVVERIAAERRTSLELVGRDWHWYGEGDNAACGSFRVIGGRPPTTDRSAQEDGGVERRPAVRLEDLTIPLLGRHQRDNAALAVAAAHELDVPAPAIRRGLAEVHWPGRLQVLRERPWLVVDGAHNGESARCLVRALLDCFEYRRLHLILGVSEGKDLDGILDALLPAADRLTLTTTRHYRALSVEALAAAVRGHGRASLHLEADVAHALHHALRQADTRDLVCVTGSLFLAGEAIEAAGPSAES
jgi:dihydrofolate synthase/folylpolyglutamate synthase